MPRRDRSYLSQTDTIMWMVEADPLLRSTIAGVAILDRPPSWEALQERVERVTHRVPTMRACVRSTPLHPTTLRWVTTPQIDLDHHLRRVRVAGRASRRDLLAIVQAEVSTPLDRARPLWRFTLVDGLRGGGAALVMVAHHVLTDGLGAVQLAGNLFDLERHPGAVPTSPPGGALPAADRDWLGQFDDAVHHDLDLLVQAVQRHARHTLDDLSHAVLHPLTATRDAVETLRSVGRVVAPARSSVSPVMTERGLALHLETLDVAVGPLQRAARRTGGTVNDVFLAVVTGALREYHRREGAPVHELRLAMPVSLRTADDAAGGNHITVMRFVVPVDDAPLSQRVARLHEVVAAVRAERSLPHTATIAAGLNLMPPGVLGSMLKKVDFLASNVPGVAVPLYLVGSEVLRFHPFGPTAGSALNITLMTYRGRCCFGITTDAAAVADPEILLDCLRAELRAVTTLSGARTATPRTTASST